ncbi:MAG: SDR family NAD(P)-dependent oxidoreductase [Crocinitomicaceae bacterium]|nr:SDR family NAD(P)-dependent oxidoreductase [Flavobacteriales bacterium]NQZ34979.1 SDR family NAD(P)-dependent oxidoreductase [Crocinitomicaceae bacterium]
MNKTVLITGANAGIGKESARQLALKFGTEKIYLACRNMHKAKAAKLELEESTGKSIFEIIIMDVSNVDSVRSAVQELEAPIDALIMNAGGMGGKTPGAKTEDGVTNMFASNVLGHIVLLDELLKAKKLNNVALFAGTEAARGIPKMKMKRPSLLTSSVEEFESIADGSYFGDKFNAMSSYGLVKYTAIMSLLSSARKHPNVRILSMSPGGTSGTEVANDMSFILRLMMKMMSKTLMPLMGMMHKLETGAKRFVDGISDETYETGIFYASKEKVLTGQVVDQSTIFVDLENESYQDNAYDAIHKFIR